MVLTFKFLACDNFYNGTLAGFSTMSEGKPFFIGESWLNNGSQSDYFKSRYYFRTVKILSSSQHRILNCHLFRWNHYLPLIALLCLIVFGCFYWLVGKLCAKIQNPNQRKRVLTIDSNLETITKTNAETSSLPSYEMIMQQKQKKIKHVKYFSETLKIFLTGNTWGQSMAITTMTIGLQHTTLSQLPCF